jgi:hypothetical protein
MAEIFEHPWINYNSLPVEIVQYKPIVDIKELNPEIVQYLIKKHEYTETDIVDAIVYRKPIALKAIYYLIEKRLKLNLGFPDTDYSSSYPDSSSADQINKLPKHMTVQINSALPSVTPNSANTVTSAGTRASSTTGLNKHNSQLLHKRTTAVALPNRSSSQKGADLKTMFNSLNIGTNNRLNGGSQTPLLNQINGQGINNNNNQVFIKSPSPDFIAAAMNPVKGIYGNNKTNHSSVSPLRHSQSRLQNNNNDYIGINRRNTNDRMTPTTYQRTQYNTSTLSNHNGSNYHQHRVKQQQPNRNGDSNNNREYQVERYYVPVTTKKSKTPTLSNRTNSPSGSDDYQTIYYQPGETYMNPNLLLNRATPDNNNNNNNNNFRPSSITSKSVPRAASTSESMDSDDHQIDNLQRIRVATNYTPAKRSNTIANGDEKFLTSNGVKNRQLNMGKAKIDLDTQHSKINFDLF